jgi:DNA-binding SARP family transcriptional activator
VDAPWWIELLGWLRATQGDRVVSRFRSHKIGALLAYLAYHVGHSHPREALIELLWPECEPAVGRNNLRLIGAAAALRRAIRAPLPPSRQTEQDEQLAALRQALGEAAFAAAWEAGQALTWEQAAALALDETGQADVQAVSQQP